MPSAVRLNPMDEKLLEPLLAVAVAEATPAEVMPPVDAPAGWSQARREAFREFHRAHYEGLDGPTGTVLYAIMTGDEVAGMIRLARRPEPGVAETGMWLGQSARGQGIGSAALRAVLTEAALAGFRLVVAETTADNAPAVAALSRCGARLLRTGTTVRAELPVPS